MWFIPLVCTGLFWIGLPLLNFQLAKKKNRSAWQWALFGIPLPIYSTLILALWPARKPGRYEYLSPGIFLFLSGLVAVIIMYMKGAS